MFVVYHGRDDMIVTTKDNEDATRDEYFTKGGRCADDYDREEINSMSFQVATRLILSNL